ncbi:MAG: rubredoxin-like domain-containing protein [Pseudomonadota bacterium]
MDQDQWVCTVCGYNMIGERPDVCPFCGARHDTFLTWQAAEETYRVTPRPVTDGVSQLMSVPRLGLEHAAYRVETAAGAFWIDCPSAFNRDLAPVEAIYFTHKDFLGASNQYRALWGAKVHLHKADAAHPLAVPFPVDVPFEADFTAPGLEAFHIGGHTPGFTVYIHESLLFACDYAFPPGDGMRLNPYGPKEATRAGAQRLLVLTEGRALATVCGYNYVTDFESWREGLTRAAA